LRTENGKLGLQPILLTKRLEIELESSGSIATLDDVKQTMGRVFHQEDIGRKVNEYFHESAKITGVNPKSGQLTIRGSGDGIYGYLEGNRPIYFPNAQVEAPKVIHKEEAYYSAAASANRTHGKAFIMVVVDERGYPAILHLLKDLGDNLDIQMLGATSQYRFRPATKDGQPVAAVFQMNWEAVTY
jgi:hypothetical protein